MRSLRTTLLLIATLGAPGLRATEPPGAWELLERIRAAYDRLEVYADQGEIEILRRGAQGVTAERFAFRTWKAPGDTLRFEIERQGTLWSSAAGAFHFDRRAGEVRAIGDLAEELARLPGIDGRALLVPRLLAAGSDVLEDPEAASVDGSTACGESTCWRLDLSYGADILQLALWVDTESDRIRSVKLERREPSEVMARAMESASQASGPIGPPSLTVRVTHDIEQHPESSAVAAGALFRPPPGTVRVGPRGARGSSGDDPPAAIRRTTAPGSIGFGATGFGEQVTVRLASLSLRAVDSKGRALENLGPEDFILEIGGERVPVESVDWVSSATNPLAEIPPAELAANDIMLPLPGKLLVLYVQSDMHPLRAKGHLKMLDHIPELLNGLHRDDYVAVVSFDSHLELQLDLTRDTSRVHDAVLAGIRGERSEWPGSGRLPSLSRHLDQGSARKAASPERGLELTAEALAAQGERDKVIVFLGWGLGRYGAFGVTETDAFRQAEHALQRASIPLFVLDITDADNHTLEVALSEIAWATGGDYIKTYLFPGQAASRIAAAMAGHYRLYYAPPGDLTGKDRLEVRLADRKGTILLASEAGR